MIGMFKNVVAQFIGLANNKNDKAQISNQAQSPKDKNWISMTKE